MLIVCEYVFKSEVENRLSVPLHFSLYHFLDTAEELTSERAWKKNVSRAHCSHKGGAREHPFES